MAECDDEKVQPIKPNQKSENDISTTDMERSIKKTNEALKIYYEYMGRADYCSNGDGLFLDFINQYSLQDVKEMDPSDVVDFDQDFPLKPPINDPTLRERKISRIIKYCYDYGQPPNTDWILWTTEDVIEWLCSFKELKKYHKQLEQSLPEFGINGYNITKQVKKDIKTNWKITTAKKRNFIYGEIQKLKQTPIHVESWTTNSVAQFMVSIFQSTEKTDQFKEQLSKEIVEEEADGQFLIEADYDDVECWVDEDDYDDNNVYKNDVTYIYDAIQMVQSANKVSDTVDEQSNPPYCSTKEDLVDDCLVVFLGISRYLQQTEAKNDVTILNVEDDHKVLEQTFSKEYSYEFIANKFYTNYTAKDVDDFLRSVRDTHLGKNGEIKHNGLIVCIAGHGCDGHLFSSSWEKISLKDIRSKFSDIVDIKYKNLPKVFVINCCRDDNDNDKGAYGSDAPDSNYSVTLLGASKSEKVYSAHFSKCVAESFSDHKNKPTKFEMIYKTIKAKYNKLRLNELDSDINDVRFRKKYDDDHIKKKKKKSKWSKPDDSWQNPKFQKKIRHQKHNSLLTIGSLPIKPWDGNAQQ